MNITKEKEKQARAKKKGHAGQIYIKDVNDNVSFINIENLKINTLNGETTLSKFIEDIEHTKKELLDINKALINTLENAQFINPNKNYELVSTNNGYVAKGKDFIVECDIPENELYKGYCYIHNHIVQIDEDKKHQYLKTFKGVK